MYGYPVSRYMAIVMFSSRLQHKLNPGEMDEETRDQIQNAVQESAQFTPRLSFFSQSFMARSRLFAPGEPAQNHDIPAKV